MRVFMKITGRRASRRRLLTATVISMALCGLWHGAGLNFLLWGLWHGVGLSVVHLFRDAKKRYRGLRRVDAFPGSGLASMGLTFLYVNLAG